MCGRADPAVVGCWCASPNTTYSRAEHDARGCDSRAAHLAWWSRMTAYLVLWNPKRWGWQSREADLRAVEGGKSVTLNWSVGVRRELPLGSRILVMRTGAEPRGLVAGGRSVGEIFEAKHWEDADKLAWCVPFRIEWMLPPDSPIPVSELERLAPHATWRPQAGGTRIDEEATAVAERLMRTYSQDLPAWSLDHIQLLEGEARLSLRRHFSRERELRDRKIQVHRQRHSGALPCEVCRLDFETTYGELGEGYAEVHHTKPLAERGAATKTHLKDLVVLCANCHAMVHRRRTALLSIGQVKAALLRVRRNEHKP